MKSTLSSSFSAFRSASSWFELYAAFSTFVMLLRTVINDLVPEYVRSFIEAQIRAFFSKREPNEQVSLKIHQFWDEHGLRNDLFSAALEYLPSRITRTYKSLKVGKIEAPLTLSFALDTEQEVVDEFEGTLFSWKFEEASKKDNNEHNLFNRNNGQSLVLTFNETQRECAVQRYLPHVLRRHEKMKADKRVLKISTYMGYWNERELMHPATFDTLALDPELKQRVVDDLDRFLKRKDLYKKMGKTWKRGYLLYGPPGTGKSSIVAAMAKYLKFDVYDFQLTSVSSNSHLIQAMRDTSNRSILVIEDIDCNKEVHARGPPPDSYTDDEDDMGDPQDSPRLTLSGLLNYMDGLWSSSGDERIVVFTTNHKDKIDPALLRPGRMDMHINLSFLRAKAFRTMASNYMDTEAHHHHPLIEKIEQLLEEIDVTPAEVAEQLMRHEDPDVGLQELIKFLQEMGVKGPAQNQPDENVNLVTL